MTNPLLEGLDKTVALALEEDIGNGDVTADLIAAETLAQATVLVRETAVICGRPWFDEVFRQVDPAISIDWKVNEGDRVAADSILCTLSGAARQLLIAERAALNFLQTLSGTATTTAQYAEALQGTHTRILDTRKTIPGLRLAQKYAVACGGGKNHRIGLYDQVLIKENHIMATGSIAQAVAQARNLQPGIKVEVETENLDEFQQALDAGADIIMVDNYSLVDMAQAVSMNRAQTGGETTIEASGNVTLPRLKDLAATGVDYISSGALTKDMKSIDLSMRFQT
ncbi:MAG: carboxylating nicotinate-nucleotide diphosphorylase [bacterium]